MVETRCRKAYVAVNLDVDTEGVSYPRFIRWEDGKIFPIEKVLYKCRASSQKVNGGGIRYTILVKGKEAYLFNEGSKWFVEEKEHA